MHYYFDFSDILDHAFKINNMFIEKEIIHLNKTNLLIDSKKIFTSGCLTQKKSIKY